MNHQNFISATGGFPSFLVKPGIAGFTVSVCFHEFSDGIEEFVKIFCHRCGMFFCFSQNSYNTARTAIRAFNPNDQTIR